MGPPRNADYDAPPISEDTRLLDLIHRGSEWRIAVYCPACMRTCKLDPADLMKRIGPDATIANVRARLRCRECGRSTDFLIKSALRSRRPARG